MFIGFSFIRLLLIFLVVLCVSFSGSAYFGGTSFTAVHAAPTQTALKSYVSTVMDKILSIVNRTDSDSARHSSFKNLISVELDIRRTALFTLGPYARSLSKEDRARFYGLFNDHLAHIFVRHMDRLLGARFAINAVRIRNAKDAIISGRLTFSDGRLPVDIQWRLYTGGDEIQIFDINIDGIWLALQQRSDFTAFIKNNRGDIDPLFRRLSSMRSK